MFHGTPSPCGVVQTFESEDTPSHVSLQTVTFAERECTTWLTQNTIYQAVEDRDRVLLYDNAEDIHESAPGAAAGTADPVS